MFGFVLALFSLGMIADPTKLPSDVIVHDYRAVKMPISLTAELRGKTKQLRLFVSEDQGKSWKHESDHEASVEFVTFEAPEDGLYWFAVQLVLKDGTNMPDDPKEFVPQKIFVNTSGKPVEVKKPYLELLRENEELRKRVKELEKKLSERQSGDKPR